MLLNDPKARLSELYAIYGELQIKAEILSSQINQVKAAIAENLKEQNKEKATEKND